MKPTFEKLASYYFLRNDHGTPYVTVCLIRNNEASRPIARGVAICGPFDNFDKDTGMKQAYRNAMRAIKGRAVDGINRREAKTVLEEVGCTFTKHGYTKPNLTGIEKAIINFI